MPATRAAGGLGSSAEGGGAVRAERVSAVPPGIPQGEETITISVDEAGFVSVGGGSGAIGGSGAGSGMVSPIVASVVGKDEGPAYRGSLPLVGARVVAEVGQRAMLSRREERHQPRQEPSPAFEEERPPGVKVDLEALAMEMADRILRRIKKEKERRGLYGL